MTLRWIEYREHWAWGLGEVEYIELHIPEGLLTPEKIESQELVNLVGEELAERHLLSNWSDKWRRVTIRVVDLPPRKVLVNALESARWSLENSARNLVRYETQLAKLPEDRLPESKL